MGNDLRKDQKNIMDVMPLVSIIMPAYNRKNVIEEAINSCLKQTYNNIEVIICDDHSTDGTEEYVRNRIQEDHRIRYCKNPEGKKGANAARNTAIRMAKGKYLVFLDSDDYLIDDSIEVRLNTFRKNPEVAMVYGNIYCELGRRKVRWIYRDLHRENENQKKFLMKNLALCPQISIMFRKEILDVIGMLNEEQKAWTDDGFVVAVGMNYPILHCHKFVSVARKSEESMTGNKWNMYIGCKMMVRKYKKDIIEYASFQRYLLWRVRLFSAWCYAKENGCKNRMLKMVWRFLHGQIRDMIRPYFDVYCE